MDALLLKRHVDARAHHADTRRLETLLDRIIPRPDLHARFVNTLARLEYVGVRKMLKSRRAERLDIDGLQHLLDEAVHALRLKKAASALAGAGGVAVTTFADADTLAGEAGEAYFQSLDRRAELALSGAELALSGAELALSGAESALSGAESDGEANYLLTSAAIEVRAQAFYPVYEQRLRAHGAPFSVSAITKDEDRHLQEMSERLQALLGPAPRGLDGVLAEEELLYGRFLAALEAAIDAAELASNAVEKPRISDIGHHARAISSEA
jgi:hypothetical protein